MTLNERALAVLGKVLVAWTASCRANPECLENGLTITSLISELSAVGSPATLAGGLALQVLDAWHSEVEIPQRTIGRLIPAIRALLKGGAKVKVEAEIHKAVAHIDKARDELRHALNVLARLSNVGDVSEALAGGSDALGIVASNLLNREATGAVGLLFGDETN